MIHLPENLEHDPDRAVILSLNKKGGFLHRFAVMNIMCSCGDLLFPEPRIRFTITDVTKAWQSHWNEVTTE